MNRKDWLKGETVVPTLYGYRDKDIFKEIETGEEYTLVWLGNIGGDLWIMQNPQVNIGNAEENGGKDDFDAKWQKVGRWNTMRAYQREVNGRDWDPHLDKPIEDNSWINTSANFLFGKYEKGSWYQRVNADTEYLKEQRYKLTKAKAHDGVIRWALQPWHHRYNRFVKKLIWIGKLKTNEDWFSASWKPCEHPKNMSPHE